MRHLLKLIPLVCLLLVACAGRDAGWEKKTTSVSMTGAEMKSIKQQAMSGWKERVNKDSLQTALTNYEKLHAADPDHLETLIYLTRGYYFLADSHIDNMDDKKKTYEKAASYGEKAMATNEAFRDSVKSGKKVEEALSELSINEVPAIYWTAASLGKWAKASGIAAALKYKTRIKAMIERVETLQPDYFFGAPSRYWGGFYAVAPSFAGGDMKKSKVQFEKSLKMAPEYLGTKVLMADVYFTKEGKKAEFEKVLNEVLASKHDKHPVIGPENTMEKKKAQKLLKNMNELF
jgi:hypothetical protein